MTRVNPHLKQDILSMISEHIYSGPYQRLNKRLEEIITKNTAMIGSGDLVLSYKGECYSCQGVRRTELKTNRLLPALRSYMDEWIADHSKLIEENRLVNTFLASVLNTSNNVSDYLRILPDCIHPALQPYARHSNVQPPLTEEQVEAIKAKNQKAVDLIKQRLLLNLIV